MGAESAIEYNEQRYNKIDFKYWRALSKQKCFCFVKQ